MTSSRSSRWRRTFLWIAVALAVPCLLSALAAGWGLPAVIASGMCPAAPPDVAAYPCSPAEYLLRMTLGPWALAGHVFLWCACGALAAVAWLALTVVRHARRPQPISELDSPAD